MASASSGGSAAGAGNARQRPPAQQWQDHPLAAWCIENGTVISLALLSSKLLQPPDRKNLARFALYNVCSGLLNTDAAIFIQYLLITRVYKHIPYFQKDPTKQPKSAHDWKLALKEWFMCNGATTAVLAVLTALLDSKMTDARWNSLATKKFRLWEFLKKLAIVRLVVDIGFYVSGVSVCLIELEFGEEDSSRLMTTLECFFRWFTELCTLGCCFDGSISVTTSTSRPPSPPTFTSL